MYYSNKFFARLYTVLANTGYETMAIINNLSLAALSLLMSSPVFAGDYIWLIGGGPSAQSSQGQIELNVKWEREVIRRQAPDAKLRIFYTDGNNPGKDVIVWQHPRESKDTLQPLARVFGAQTHNGESYHSHTIPDVVGSTRADTLVADLKKEFAALKQGDRALLIFYGHGTFEGKDVGLNALRLWDNTQLTARELESLFSGINPDVPVRFVLPQCFSGGFSRVMHPRGDDVRELVPNNRCGFMSVPKNRESEGCSPSINVGDFRDYSTYFFAALDGRTRLGKKLSPGIADRNADGLVSLREAHLYSIASAVSVDSPRSTSEVFLEDWQPWYLRWLPIEPTSADVYQKLVTQLAVTNSLPLNDRALMKALTASQRSITNERDSMKLEKDEIGKSMKKLQTVIRADVAVRWPEAMNPYTLSYYKFLRSQLDQAQDFIVHHADYPKLVSQQERLLQLDTSILAADRKLAQFDKIIRLRRLSWLSGQFQRFANDKDRASYARLLACEETQL